MFGRVTIRLGIGPHSSLCTLFIPVIYLPSVTVTNLQRLVTVAYLLTSLSLSFVVNFPTSFDSVRPRPRQA